MRFEFVVPGKPLGYTTHNRSNDRGGNKISAAVGAFWNYCKHVRKCAEAQCGVAMPLESSPENPWYIFTVAMFPTKNHADPENVHKGIKDALFYKAKCGDKYTGGAYVEPFYDKNYPCVLVTCIQAGDLRP